MAHITATRRPASDLTEGYPVPQCEERARLHLANYMYQRQFYQFYFQLLATLCHTSMCNAFMCFSCTNVPCTSGTPGTPGETSSCQPILQVHLVLAIPCHTSRVLHFLFLKDKPWSWFNLFSQKGGFQFFESICKTLVFDLFEDCL